MLTGSVAAIVVECSCTFQRQMEKRESPRELSLEKKLALASLFRSLEQDAKADLYDAVGERDVFVISERTPGNTRITDVNRRQ